MKIMVVGFFPLAPLTGLIGVNGAIGVFSNYENTGDAEGYALGGGFVVD